MSVPNKYFAGGSWKWYLRPMYMMTVTVLVFCTPTTSLLITWYFTCSQPQQSYQGETQSSKTLAFTCSMTHAILCWKRTEKMKLNEQETRHSWQYTKHRRYSLIRTRLNRENMRHICIFSKGGIIFRAPSRRQYPKILSKIRNKQETTSTIVIYRKIRKNSTDEARQTVGSVSFGAAKVFSSYDIIGTIISGKHIFHQSTMTAHCTEKERDTLRQKEVS